MAMHRDDSGEKVHSARKIWKTRIIQITAFLAVIAVSSAGAAQIGKISSRNTRVRVENSLRLNGQLEMSEGELRSIVASNHLLVYWAGPEQDSQYILTATNPEKIVLRIVPASPAGRSPRTSYPQITTYALKNAFESVLYGGGNLDVGGFINADGHALFYTHTDPNEAFVGIRGKDIEIQVYDPTEGEALQFATEAGRLVPITGGKS